MEEILRDAIEADRQRRGEPVGEVFTMEALDGSGDARSHVLLNKPLPAGTKLYAAPVAAHPDHSEQDLNMVAQTTGYEEFGKEAK
jgi:hypothetical protein